jgi:hypothetical protein
MGVVHFLHGNPKPPDVEKPTKTIRCPNKNCLRLINKVGFYNGKKVCPHCKTIISEKLLKNLEQNTSDEEYQEIPCSNCGRLTSEYLIVKKKKVCPYCENPFTREEIKHLKRVE